MALPVSQRGRRLLQRSYLVLAIGFEVTDWARNLPKNQAPTCARAQTLPYRELGKMGDLSPGVVVTHWVMFISL